MKKTRREFLVTAAAAPILSPMILGASDKSGAKAPVLGHGDTRYEAIHDWGRLPPHIKWGNTHGVVEDAAGNIYVHHTVHATSDSADSMVVFDPAGRFVRSWGGEFRGVAHGLHIRREGRDEFLYLTLIAANPRTSPQPGVQAAVVKATTRGEIVWTIAGPPDIDAYRATPGGAPARYSPTNVAIAPNGDVYVGDGYGSYYINLYNAKGEYLRTFGGKGSGPGQLNEPHGLWVDTRGKSPVLVVADRRNNRLQRFTLDGRHLDFITGRPGSAALADSPAGAGLRLPCHFHERKGVVVIPDLHGRVTLMDRDNRVIEQLGDSRAADWNNPLRSQPREAFIPGQFICPHGACFDRHGNIFVVEWVEVGRVTKLRKVA